MADRLQPAGRHFRSTDPHHPAPAAGAVPSTAAGDLKPRVKVRVWV